ncbi:MAG: class I SAM-dependent methyltransferase [Bacteroidota bacterium]
MAFHQIRQYGNFYFQAVTQYQLHSPFVFELATAVLEDDRDYYAFRDVELLRKKMLASDVWIDRVDFGAQEGRRREMLRKVVANAASSPRQGKMLFRLANHLHPQTMLELGTSTGIGAMYLASGARNARFRTLEGCPQTAAVARNNAEILGLHHVEVTDGPFEQTLLPALNDLKTVDLFYLDGNHRPEPTLRYFEQCLPYAKPKAVFVFDDIYWSAGMTDAWKKIQEHPKVTLTVDFFAISLAFIDPAFKQKQHFRVVPTRQKPWKIF